MATLIQKIRGKLQRHGLVNTVYAHALRTLESLLALKILRGVHVDRPDASLLGWRHGGGFSVHNRVWVAADDPEGRMKLAGYRLRAPLSLAKMSYDAASAPTASRPAAISA